MNLPIELVWAIFVALILSAIAWGKTQSDVSWIKRTLVRLEERYDALSDLNQSHHSHNTRQ